jgi:transposase
METQEKKGFRRSQRDYGLSFKLAVVKEVEKGELSYPQAQKKYGIQGKTTVLTWLRKLGTLDWNDKQSIAMNKPDPTPEQRIKELETLLQKERDRNLVYKTMIDIYEERQNHPQKKSLPKPSKDSDTQKS